jgi:hypothetical protein
MSRILDALKKAVPGNSSKGPAAPAQKPLAIFEKVIFESNEREEARSQIEAKKESARLRYLLNEGPGARAYYPERGPSGRTGMALAAIFLLAVFLGALAWTQNLRNVPVSETQLQRTIADKELQLTALRSENADLKKLTEVLRREKDRQTAATDARAKKLQAENEKLKHGLEVVLQDNLAKDRILAERSSGSEASGHD